MLHIASAQWWEWSLSNTSSVAQTVLTAAGFTLAIVQLWRTANATQSSRKLLENLRVRLIGNDLLLMLPDLHVLEDSLDDAIRADEPQQVERALIAYSRKASEIVGVLESDDNTKELGLGPLLSAAARECTKAKGEIAEGTERTLRAATSQAAKKISAANYEATVVKSRLHRKGD